VAAAPFLPLPSSQELTGDYRSRPDGQQARRWTRLCGCCAASRLETLSRELRIEADRLAAWRDDFLAGGKQALKGQRPTDHPMTGRSSRLSARSAGRSPGTQRSRWPARPLVRQRCRSNNPTCMRDQNASIIELS
jgi:hypothetical protein